MTDNNDFLSVYPDNSVKFLVSIFDSHNAHTTTDKIAALRKNFLRDTYIASTGGVLNDEKELKILCYNVLKNSGMPLA